jgi:hypothetical protein
MRSFLFLAENRLPIQYYWPLTRSLVALHESVKKSGRELKKQASVGML